jgi:predicted Rossmann fold flavoprotein
MKVAIIGAGACGLMLANLLNEKKIDYTIFNKGKIGRKILASGNGRCNISNTNLNKNSYNNEFAYKLVNDNINDLFDLFNKLHIYTKSDNEGRLYPLSESSQSVLNILLKNISNDKIIDLEINSINKKNDKYYLNNSYGPFDKIIIAIGSNASYIKPYNSINIINELNIKFNQFKPSLVGFKTSLKLKEISGVRQKGNVSLYKDDKLIHSEDGEFIFKDDGISGICIMNLSSYYQRLDDRSKTYIKLDLSPNNDYKYLDSVLNPKLLNYINKNNINYHNFIIPIKDVYDFEFAQVSNGGIDISEINNNLSLKKDNNIYVGGEIIDVDGLCGGYNLMFAFTSAIIISKNI